MSTNASIVWRMERDHWAVRFMEWAWDADPRTLNFCKLFWGLLFSPLAVVWHVLVSKPVRWVFRGLAYIAVAVSVLWVIGVLVFLLLTEDKARVIVYVVAASAVGSAVAIAAMRAVGRRVDDWLDRSDISRPALLKALVGFADPLVRAIADGVRLAFRPVGWLFARTFAVIVLWLYVRLFGPINADEWIEWNRRQKDREKERARRVNSVLSIFAGFYHGIKDRTCPTIEVVGPHIR